MRLQIALTSCVGEQHAANPFPLLISLCMYVCMYMICRTFTGIGGLAASSDAARDLHDCDHIGPWTANGLSPSQYGRENFVIGQTCIYCHPGRHAYVQVQYLLACMAWG